MSFMVMGSTLARRNPHSTLGRGISARRAIIADLALGLIRDGDGFEENLQLGLGNVATLFAIYTGQPVGIPLGTRRVASVAEEARTFQVITKGKVDRFDVLAGDHSARRLREVMAALLDIVECRWNCLCHRC